MKHQRQALVGRLRLGRAVVPSHTYVPRACKYRDHGVLCIGQIRASRSKCISSLGARACRNRLPRVFYPRTKNRVSPSLRRRSDEANGGISPAGGGGCVTPRPQRAFELLLAFVASVSIVCMTGCPKKWFVCCWLASSLQSGGEFGSCAAGQRDMHAHARSSKLRP